MTADEYIETRLDDQIDWYDRKSQHHQKWYKTLRFAEIVAASAIPVLSGLVASGESSVPVIIGTLGAAVAVVAGILGLYQFEQHWVEYRTTCESLKKEKYLFVTGTEPFDDDPEANFQLMVQRVETLISKENTNWAQYIMRPNHKEATVNGA